jgi:hypothetical protein
VAQFFVRLAHFFTPFLALLSTPFDNRNPLLPKVGNAGSLPCLFAGLSKNRKENGGEYRDNGDDHKQFDEGKTGTFWRT